MILSSPGCNMKEFMARPGLSSPAPMTMDGFPPRNHLEASGALSLIRAASQVICMCGTWLAMSGVKNEVLTPGTFVICCEMPSSRDCHSRESASWSSAETDLAERGGSATEKQHGTPDQSARVDSDRRKLLPSIEQG